MRKSGELRAGRERTDAREDVRLFFYVKNGGRMEKPKGRGAGRGNREAHFFSREIGIRSAARRKPTGTGGF